MKTGEQCHVCGRHATSVRTPIEIRVRKRAATVNAERMRCDDCGAEFYLPGQMSAAQNAAADRMRAEDGLLAPHQVREIRERFALTQAQMETLLGVGPKTVVRWERGHVFQNSATDALLRVITAVPAAAAYLAARRGVALRGVSLGATPSPQQIDRPAVRYRIGNRTPTESARVLDTKVIPIEPFLGLKPAPIPPELLTGAQL